MLLRAGLPATSSLTRIDPAAVAAAHSPNTRTAYAPMWRHWEHWCAARHLPALPADPLTLCAYLTERADAQISVSIPNLSGAAIRHVHRLCGVRDPVGTEIVRQVRHGLARTYGTAPTRLARPTLGGRHPPDPGCHRPDHSRRTTRRRDDPVRLRLRASRQRAGRLALDDVTRQPAGLLVRVRTAKTDPRAAANPSPSPTDDTARPTPSPPSSPGWPPGKHSRRVVHPGLGTHHQRPTHRRPVDRPHPRGG
jgi:hypothetical protein